MRFAHGSGTSDRPRPTFVTKATSWSQITELQKSDLNIDTDPFLIAYVVTKVIVGLVLVAVICTSCVVADQIDKGATERTCIQQGGTWETMRGSTDYGCVNN